MCSYIAFIFCMLLFFKIECEISVWVGIGYWVTPATIFFSKIENTLGTQDTLTDCVSHDSFVWNSIFTKFLTIAFHNIFFYYHFIIYNEIYKFSVCLCCVKPILLFLSTAVAYQRFLEDVCYCCTVKAHVLELYLQFRVRVLFPLFWQGSWFRMSSGKL